MRGVSECSGPLLVDGDAVDLGPGALVSRFGLAGKRHFGSRSRWNRDREIKAIFSNPPRRFDPSIGRIVRRFSPRQPTAGLRSNSESSIRGLVVHKLDSRHVLVQE